MLTKNVHFSPLSILPKTEILVHQMATSACEKDKMMSVGSNLPCGCPHGADPPLPHVST